MQTLVNAGRPAIGIDVKTSLFTHHVGSITDRDFVKRCMAGVHAVLHTATLHKPHVVTHSRQAFIDTNITGTLNLLEESTAAGVMLFVYTSTTSVFGRALKPPRDEPAAWITEDVVPAPKNIYGVTKIAAEHLCELFHVLRRLPCVILRTSRFFPEADDRQETRQSYDDCNVKVNEFLFRRADIEDVVDAHLPALMKAETIGFGRHRERDDAVYSPRSAGASRERPGNGQAPRAPLRRAVRQTRMVDVPGDRSRVRERAGQARVGLEATVQLR